MTRVLVVATARPTFAIDVATERVQTARELLASLGADVVGPRGLIMTTDDVTSARDQIDLDADAVVHVCATFSDAGPAVELWEQLDRPLLLWAFREPGEVGQRLLLNSLCGANLAAHALVRAGHDVRLCYGDPEEPAVQALLTDLLAGRLPPPPMSTRSHGERAPADVARLALQRLQGTRIGALGDGPTGFSPSEYDPVLLHDTFGVDVAPRSLPSLFDAVADVPVEVRARERSEATDWQPSLKTLDDATLDRFASVTVALRDWHVDERLDALAIRCWPEFPTELGVCPCSSLSRLADERLPTQCERDVYGATTMLLLEALGAGPSFLVDTVDLDEADNVVRFWHCGAAATQLARDPGAATQSVHANRQIGVAGDFALRPGRVCAARLTEDLDRPGALRLLVASGTALEAPNRFQGNTADVRLDGDARAFVLGLVAGGFPHHTVLAWRDVRPGLRSVADQLGIPVVEFD